MTAHQISAGNNMSSYKTAVKPSFWKQKNRKLATDINWNVTNSTLKFKYHMTLKVEEIKN